MILYKSWPNILCNCCPKTSLSKVTKRKSVISKILILSEISIKFKEFIVPAQLKTYSLSIISLNENNSLIRSVQYNNKRIIL